MTDSVGPSSPVPDAGQLAGAPRQQLIRFLASAINELTVAARAAYEPSTPAVLKRCNEAIHRLSGHLVALIDADEPMTVSRADGILEQLKALHPTTVSRLLRATPLDNAE